MNGTTTPTGFPGFAPGEHRHLLADVHRWARTNGWTWHECWGWVNAPYASNATLGIDWDNGTITVRTGQVLLRPGTYPVANARQAVDMLVALGILPAQFSSAYAAGRGDALADDWDDYCDYGYPLGGKRPCIEWCGLKRGHTGLHYGGRDNIGFTDASTVRRGGTR